MQSHLPTREVEEEKESENNWKREAEEGNIGQENQEARGQGRMTKLDEMTRK